MHPPSIWNPGRVLAGDSSQDSLEHPEDSAYRCFLPDLTGFTGLRRPGPNSPHPPVRIEVLNTDLGREFHPAVAGCGYRAPLAPRVARPRHYRRADAGRCQLGRRVRATASRSLSPVRRRREARRWLSQPWLCRSLAGRPGRAFRPGIRRRWRSSHRRLSLACRW